MLYNNIVKSSESLNKWKLFNICSQNTHPIGLLIFCNSSRKHAYIILTPHKPHFHIIKLGFTGVYIIFLIFARKHRLWVLVRTASPQKSENYRSFLSENFQFLEVKFSLHLNRRVFVMYSYYGKIENIRFLLLK